MQPLLITSEAVSELLPMQECIRVMEQAFCALNNGKCVQPLRSSMKLPDGTGLMGMMPSYSEEIGMMAIKVISVYPLNRRNGYPSHQGSVLLFEAEHGQLLCIADAGEITKIRTAAVSAVATQLLAKKDSSILALLGSGEQARSHIEAMMMVRKIETIRLWSLNSKHAKDLADEISGKLPANMLVFQDAQECITGANIICTVTNSSEPVVKGEWLAGGTHVNAVGSCTPYTRELDGAAMLKSKLFTDRYESLFREAGDFIIAKSEGMIDDMDVEGELGEVLCGIKPGRKSEDEITVFKSLGIGIEDLYATHHIYRKLAKK